MTPIDWALRPLKKYADFSGRAPRAEYWWFAVAYGIVAYLLEYLDGSLGGPVAGLYGPTSLAFAIGLFIPGVAVTVRRLHDIGRSGWWALLDAGYYAITLVGLLASNPEQMFDSLEPTSPMIIPIIALVVAVIVLLIFTILRGNTGSNDYGPDPYGEHEDLEAVFS
jgi:uncharacterized membrane protein YhaH (DUF805 family)